MVAVIRSHLLAVLAPALFPTFVSNIATSSSKPQSLISAMVLFKRANALWSRVQSPVESIANNSNIVFICSKHFPKILNFVFPKKTNLLSHLVPRILGQTYKADVICKLLLGVATMLTQVFFKLLFSYLHAITLIIWLALLFSCTVVIFPSSYCIHYRVDEAK